jgi:hypothetical protein
MKLKLSLVLALLLGSMLAHADDRRDERSERQEPPKFVPHPAGQHPHGAMVRPHPVRVLQPRVIERGAHVWAHWPHPEFARPVYYWNWGIVHSVSCIGEDSYGDQYPVTQATFSGFALVNMTAIEDSALDRCYAESGGDPTCFLLTCSHF